jgi:SAM-dependent methyltransferase
MSERSETSPDDPYDGRQPTSHELRSGRPWNASYQDQDGPAPWDIGQPQPAIVRLASEGGFAGSVLDAGCGSGENALLVAAQGLPVLGVDVAGTALSAARAKAEQRGIKAEFAQADALHLERLGRTFDTVLDCGLFHSFEDDEFAQYVASLASVTEPGATVYVLCFGDDGTESSPHPISQDQLRAAFNPSAGWEIADIRPETLLTNIHDDGAPAWLATVTRT